MKIEKRKRIVINMGIKEFEDRTHMESMRTMRVVKVCVFSYLKSVYRL